ncbi:MAG: hypothetical protein IIB81_01380, partial [Nanoarchaeota archaeon]|nr:hypothetical protein [Nanoarchaeota archaeon]
MADNPQIERKIIIGLISSTEFIKQVREIYHPKLMISDAGKRLSRWCIEYFDEYKEAPNKNIEGIYLEKLRKGLPKDIAEEIDEDFLPKLNEEYLKAEDNIDYLVTQTREYWQGIHLQNHNEKVQAL